jgi:hypothetical protein
MQQKPPEQQGIACPAACILTRTLLFVGLTRNQFKVYIEFSVNYATILMYYYKKIATL